MQIDRQTLLVMAVPYSHVTAELTFVTAIHASQYVCCHSLGWRGFISVTLCLFQGSQQRF